jgi:hypothetical protein
VDYIKIIDCYDMEQDMTQILRLQNPATVAMKTAALREVICLRLMNTDVYGIVLQSYYRLCNYTGI